jgi:hypothetical protein
MTKSPGVGIMFSENLWVMPHRGPNKNEILLVIESSLDMVQ